MSYTTPCATTVYALGAHTTPTAHSRVTVRYLGTTEYFARLTGYCTVTCLSQRQGCGSWVLPSRNLKNDYAKNSIPSCGRYVAPRFSVLLREPNEHKKCERPQTRTRTICIGAMSVCVPHAHCTTFPISLASRRHPTVRACGHQRAAWNPRSERLSCREFAAEA